MCACVLSEQRQEVIENRETPGPLRREGPNDLETTGFTDQSREKAGWREGQTL